MQSFTIGRLAKSAGMGVETVRYYQRRGLLPLPTRTRGSARRYGQADLERLRYIRAAQRLGFTLTEICLLTTCVQRGDETEARQLVQKKLDFLDLRIRGLTHMRGRLASLLPPTDGLLTRLQRNIESAAGSVHERLAAMSGSCQTHVRRRMESG